MFAAKEDPASARELMNAGRSPDQLPAFVQISPCFVDLERESGGVANIVRQISLKLADSNRTTLLLCGNRELGRRVAEPGTRKISERLLVVVFEQRANPLMGPVSLLRSQLKTLPPSSIVHVHTCFSAFTEEAMRCVWRRRIPFVFTPHGKLSRQAFEKHRWLKALWWRLLAKRLVRKASRVALSSPREAEVFDDLGIARSFDVIANGYEMPNEIVRTHKDSNVAKPYVLFLGYIDPRKQPEFLVRVFAQSKLRNTHCLVLAGPDLYAHGSAVQAAARVAGLTDQLIFTGAVYGDAKWSLLRNARCLCLPSLSEGLPVVLCEAMGAGIPSVYSKNCNFPEIANHGGGIEIAGFEVSKWCAALERLCLDNEQRARMCAAATATATAYTWKSIVAKWTTLYESVLQNSAQGRRRKQ